MIDGRRMQQKKKIYIFINDFWLNAEMSWSDAALHLKVEYYFLFLI